MALAPVGPDGLLTTAGRMAQLEELGFQFLKDKNGWACYDADTRKEVEGSRHKHLGDAIYLVYNRLT